jgi:hypothetical protein
MMTIDQIIVQAATEETVDRAIVQHGPMDKVEQKIVVKEDLTQEEKDLWDAFVAMLKSKE